MIRQKRLLATAMIASLAVTACSDVTAPKNEPTAGNQSDARPVTEVSFIKWFTTYPTMTGNTSLGAGTFAGTITKRVVFDNGVIVQLGATYQVRDPSGEHSFTAAIEGTENLETASAVLNGVVTAGWRVGAQVHVTFDIIRPCALATGPTAVGTCFQGTIRIQG
jgi:hypothetical protein